MAIFLFIIGSIVIFTAAFLLFAVIVYGLEWLEEQEHPNVGDPEDDDWKGHYMG